MNLSRAHCERKSLKAAILRWIWLRMVSKQLCSSAKRYLCVDVMLPHKDGYSIAKEIRKADPTILSFCHSQNANRKICWKAFESGVMIIYASRSAWKSWSCEWITWLRLRVMENQRHNPKVLRLGFLSSIRFDMNWKPKVVSKTRIGEAKLAANAGREPEQHRAAQRYSTGNSGRWFVSSTHAIWTYITKLRDYLKEHPP